jgi:hypothetical protein
MLSGPWLRRANPEGGMSLSNVDGGINTGKMILGGLVAGVVINAGELVANMFLFDEDFGVLLDTLNLTEPTGTSVVLFNGLGFLLGIGTAWLYAAIRPRFGAGPKTGVCAGLAVWGFFYLLPEIGQSLMGMYPMTLVVIYTED